MIPRISAIFLGFFSITAAAACASSSDSSTDQAGGGRVEIGGAGGASGAASNQGGSQSMSGAGTASSSAGTASAGTSSMNGASGNAGASTSSNGGASSVAGASSGGASSTPATAFGQVTALLDKRCAGSKCHSSSGTQLPFASTSGSALYGLLTTPVPSGTPHCVGVTLVTPNDAQSPLLEIVASGGKIACTSPKKENVGPMPDKCTTTSTTDTGKCLTADEIKVLSDWVLAGAPQN